MSTHMATALDPQDDIFALENDYYVAKQAADEAIAEAWQRIRGREYAL